MNGNTIEIRPVIDVDEIKQIEEIQRATWGMDDLAVIPARVFHVMQTNGACLLGAFDGEKIVGFVFGLLGTMEGLDDRIDQIAAARLLMYSVTLGILPEYQREGIGYRLKIAQREFALRIGVRLITWTCDPLESLNGHFNFSKLGVVCHSYLRNYYGQMSGINVGLPSDRFYVEWWVTGNRVTSRVSRSRGPLNLSQYLGGNAKIINQCERDARMLPIPQESYLQLDGSLLLVQIPEDFQLIKSVDQPLALDWRHHIRAVFEHYFDHDYLVTDFVREQDDEGVSHSYYVLTQASGGS